jgi:hypothetical protein
MAPLREARVESVVRQSVRLAEQDPEVLGAATGGGVGKAA